MANEKELRAVSGWLMVVVLAAVAAAGVWGGITVDELWMRGVAFWLAGAAGACFAGLTVVNPNEASVVTLFGVYKGTLKRSGFWWVNPLTTRRKLSLRVRNFESTRLKVNERDGNPIEIAAVVVWRIVETFEAVFNVDDFENYVHVQSEAAVRNLATSYPYDAHDDQLISLRGHTNAIADHLKREIKDRLSKAGVDVIEARISHLAYAAEIAAAMLQRQQAGAIIAARQRLVDGAVGMVEMALDPLAAKSIIQLHEERK